MNKFAIQNCEINTENINAVIAMLIEHWIETLGVLGSIPIKG